MRRFFLIAVVLLLSSSQALACSCTENPPAADISFIGKVLDVTSFEDQHTKEVKFEVIEGKRGITRQYVIVATALTGAECGYDFEKNGTYLVQANWDGRKLTTGACFGNQRYEILGEEEEESETDLDDEVVIESSFE